MTGSSPSFRKQAAFSKNNTRTCMNGEEDRKGEGSRWDFYNLVQSKGDVTALLLL